MAASSSSASSSSSSAGSHQKQPSFDSHADADSGREKVIQILEQQAGVALDDATKARLPTWQQVVAQYGNGPVIVGLETCLQFRQSVPAVRRMLGAAGMFSTGTNLVTHLLKRNCFIPERAALYPQGQKATKEQLGMRWQVPWGKHTPAYYKTRHATEQAQSINKDDILPIVTVRNPWRWMQSMCKNPYSARWPHFRTCPNLKVPVDDTINITSTTTLDDSSSWRWNPVTVKYGAGSDNYTSLVHLWMDWYQQYWTTQQTQQYPVLIVRMEDLVFFTESTISQICTCAGGQLYSSNGSATFTYVVESAKADSPGHDTSTGLTQAWIKYSQPLQPQAGFVPTDYQAAWQALHDNDNNNNNDLMHRLGYQDPPPTLASSPPPPTTTR